MKKVKVKQGTLDWELIKLTRIGSSEIFDIVRYYASDEELLNCGIDIDKIRDEEPYTSAWALYHKMKNDGKYQKMALAPEFAEYGHAVEPYGLWVLQQGRKKKLKAGEVYVSDKLVASIDITGKSEEIDVQPFYKGNGMVSQGKRFVCEQKTIMPYAMKKGLPLKHVIQAQYQISMIKADFYILQVMILHNDNPFERGKITQMGTKKKREYLTRNMDVTHYYFRHNEHISMLIKTCLERFFTDVDNSNEPAPCNERDKKNYIITELRANSFYNDSMVQDYDLSAYIRANNESAAAQNERDKELQKIFDFALKNNASRFRHSDGTTAFYDARGAFRLKLPKE